MTFAFVGSAGGADIISGSRPATDDLRRDHRGVHDGRGDHVGADVRVVRPSSAAPSASDGDHETAHASASSDHTADGGLMDLDGGNGDITALGLGVLRNLYSTCPRAPSSGQASGRGPPAPGGGTR